MDFQAFCEIRFSRLPYDFGNNPFGFRNTDGSDISAHLPMLAFVAKDCNHITEFGTRECFSTAAFLSTCKGKVVSYDINRYQDIDLLQSLVSPDVWTFIQHDTGDPNLEIDNTDLLFIDSLHSSEHVAKELRHAKNVNRYIAFHDTYTTLNRPGESDINIAINDFLDKNKNWKKVYEVKFNHGLIIVEKNEI